MLIKTEYSYTSIFLSSLRPALGEEKSLPPGKSQTQPLTLNHMQGPLAILGLGLILATLTALAERAIQAAMK